MWHAEIIDETTAGIGSLMNLEPEPAIALLDDAHDGLRAAYGLEERGTAARGSLG
ncbi:hypothetical protein [Arthrobacter sp. 2MCAF14]|uniref:hypothetical protein n=1 Tax=Arthrobacter sp. 2MCAF14 TaxID=3232982 RepID=UPI003F8E7134